MLGAIIGDIVGSRHEFNNIHTKDFEFMHPRCYFTDDTVMTCAIAEAMLSREFFDNVQDAATECMLEVGQNYPTCGYGGRFIRWMFEDPEPYNSFGNGSAMRVSSVAWVAKDLDECKQLAHDVTVVSHNHPEGMKGAEATAVATWMALHGSTKEEILDVIEKDYYKLDFTIDGIRDGYKHSEACQNTVPQAFEAFKESKDYEDCIRIAVSLGGDSDTIAAIAGAVAEAYYGIPKRYRDAVVFYLDERLYGIARDFEKTYGFKQID